MAARAKQELTVQVKAEARWVRLSARKARVVLQHIRGRSVPEARTVLAFTQRAAAHEIEKVLKSAVANAESNHGLIGDELIVAATYADEGPTLKRWRPRARGRVNRIFKRTCHITIVLGEDPKAEQRPRRRAAAATATPAQDSPSASAPKASKRKQKQKQKEAVA